MLILLLIEFSCEFFCRNIKVGSHTGTGRLAAALVDLDTAFASGILEVADKEGAAPWTIDIGDNAAARSQRKAVFTLLRKDFSGIDGIGHESNTHEGDEEQLVGKHLEAQGLGL